MRDLLRVVGRVEVIETGNIVSESKKREENACDGSVIKLSVRRETSDRMAETHAPRSSGNEFQPKWKWECGEWK